MKNKKPQPYNLLKLNINTNTKRVSNRESEHREFKLKFENSGLPKFAKTMASFANRDGGVIFIGIRNNPREIIGIPESDIPDDVVFTNFLNEYFQPEISFESKTIDLCDKKIHCLIVNPSIRKPVICKKTKSIKSEPGKADSLILREGAIYYRYSASSDEIKYADLNIILDDERKKYFKSMIDNITLLNSVGINRAAIVDAMDLSGSNQTASIYITNETAKNMNWIDGGKFVEEEGDGAKAYYVVRNVEIKQGIEISKPTDFNKSHPITKTSLTKSVKISANDIDSVLWKLGIKDNLKYHYPSSHGKNKIHKFTETAKELILKSFPLDLENRKEQIKSVVIEHRAALRE